MQDNLDLGQMMPSLPEPGDQLNMATASKSKT